MQETDCLTTIITIRSCKIAIYYSSVIYSYIKDVLFGQKAVAPETMMLASELKSQLVDKLKDSAADCKANSCA